MCRAHFIKIRISVVSLKWINETLFAWSNNDRVHFLNQRSFKIRENNQIRRLLAKMRTNYTLERRRSEVHQNIFSCWMCVHIQTENICAVPRRQWCLFG